MLIAPVRLGIALRSRRRRQDMVMAQLHAMQRRETFFLPLFPRVIEHLYKEHCKKKGKEEPLLLVAPVDEELMWTDQNTFWQKV